MCQIVEEYAKEKADFQKAIAIVEDIENLMETSGMTEKQACKALKRTLKAYKDAKKLLSANIVDKKNNVSVAEALSFGDKMCDKYSDAFKVLAN